MPLTLPTVNSRPIPASLEEAYGQAVELSFFSPTHFWFGGKFIEIGGAPVFQADGRVSFPSMRGFAASARPDTRTSTSTRY